MIYLDNNATTPIDSEVLEDMFQCLRENFGNPSSGHNIGKKAKEAVEKARQEVAELINARPEEIIFTSGGTEANNMAILGTALTLNQSVKQVQSLPRIYFGDMVQGKAGHIITSSIEHPSVMQPCKYLAGLGFEITYLRVDRFGLIDVEGLRSAIREDTILITIMHSNNEIGTLQPIKEIGKIAKSRGIVFHSDAAQSVGKVPVDVNELNVDLMSIVSHKFYGPKGIGAIYKRDGVELRPILFGAGHERGLRPGTENVPCIVGLGKACEIAKRDIQGRVSYAKFLSEKLHRGLEKEIPDLKLNGHPDKRLPNTLNLCFPGTDASSLIEKLKGKIAASTGSACHAGKHTPSPVLKAIGLSDKDAFSSVRFSVGKDNTGEEVKEAVRIIMAHLNLQRRFFQHGKG